MLQKFMWSGLMSVTLGCLLASPAMARGILTIGPYASVSSTKSIKPSKDKSNSEETVNQRTTYGIRAGIRLGKFFNLNVQAGTNKVDTTKKAVALRDEYGDIDFEKDANVNPDDQEAEYRYQEEQRLATVKLEFQPVFFSWLWAKAGAGVRARQRLISIEDPDPEVGKQKITDPIRYHAVATAGVGARIFRTLSGHIEYNFYFMKFPKTEPHEQEVAVGFGIQL